MLSCMQSLPQLSGIESRIYLELALHITLRSQLLHIFQRYFAQSIHRRPDFITAMAEPIGIGSGIIAFITTAINTYIPRIQPSNLSTQ